ncbi:MAG: aminopeptidase [Anaerolineales bacterium]|nr:aminopeptidase [Anaerolineales bacterium]
MSLPDFEEKLAVFAELILNVGLNIQPQQRLVILAGLEAVELVHEVTAQAYRGGSPLVTVLWVDEMHQLIRLRNAPESAMNEFSNWAYDLIPACLERGDAYLQIGAITPGLLKGHDPELVARASRAAEEAYYPTSVYQGKNQINWSLVRVPTIGWARKLFPDLDAAAAVDRLWSIIFETCRLNEGDPIRAWEDQFRTLGDRCAYLNERQFQALHFRSPVTDLIVGLPEGQRWFGGNSETTTGVTFAPNLPTEEIFSMAHRARVDGYVRASKPLNYKGSLIEDFSITFRDGEVVELNAGRGEDTLRRLVAADEGARRLGEVALVPHRSPISQTGMVFYDSLFDENAASHLALGSAYKFTIKGGEAMAAEEFERAGGNESMIHVDFMIGSGDMDVTAREAGGNEIKILEQGDWVASV